MLGTTPELILGGLPDDAFAAIEGDDKKACAVLKKRNKVERAGRGPLFAAQDAETQALLQHAAAELEALPDDRPEEIRAKELAFRRHEETEEYRHKKQLADAWCSAFVIRRHFREPGRESSATGITQGHLNDLAEGRPLDTELYDEIALLSCQYQFFHWHLAFPEVFANGGFDCVLGNPPWERVKLQDKEWFAERSPAIANAPNAAARGRMIAALEVENPALLAAFREDIRRAEGESCLLRNSGRFPLCGKGDINTYAVFAETNRSLVGSGGRVGCIVPSGIASDNTTKEFFANLIDSNTLVSLYDFENAVGLFEGVGHGRFKFCLLTIAGSPRVKTSTPDFFFFAHHVTDLEDQNRHFSLSAEEIALINPNTRTCPIFRSKRDAEITKTVYRKIPVLIKEGPPEENPWKIRFQRMFDMSNDSHLFRTKDQLQSEGFQLQGNTFHREGEAYLPLYEAKMMFLFTHRYGDYALRPEGSQDTELPRIPVAQLRDSNYVVLPKYWLPASEVIKATSDVPRIVIQAIEAKSEEQARLALSAWFAGHALANGRENAGDTILIQNVLSVWDSMETALQTRFAAMLLHEEYPLDDSDFFWDRSDMTYLEAADALIRKRTPKWLLGFRDITNATNERTAVFSVLPPVGVGHKAPLVYLRDRKQAFFVGATSSLVFDYVTRQSMGGTSLGYFILKQLPILQPHHVTDEQWEFVASRVLELVYTARDVKGYADTFAYYGQPFLWDEGRRFLLRCELDAFYFHVYGITRDDVDYIMHTFPITYRKEEQQHGEYRTKRVILEIYDAMAEALRTGRAYQTCLSPPPADPRVAHAAIEQPVTLPSLHAAVGQLSQFAAAAWATPALVTPDHLALFALIDVIRAFGGSAKPSDVRAAAILVRNPAMALAFLDQQKAKEWVRVIGHEAQPLPTNVVSITQFQRNAADLVWSRAIAQLTGSGALQAGADRWIAADNFPASSGQDWVAGRSAIAVELVSTVLAADLEVRLTAFLRSVEDGTARRAVS